MCHTSPNHAVRRGAGGAWGGNAVCPFRLVADQCSYDPMLRPLRVSRHPGRGRCHPVLQALRVRQLKRHHHDSPFHSISFLFIIFHYISFLFIMTFGTSPHDVLCPAPPFPAPQYPIRVLGHTTASSDTPPRPSARAHQVLTGACNPMQWFGLVCPCPIRPAFPSGTSRAASSPRGPRPARSATGWSAPGPGPPPSSPRSSAARPWSR